MRITLVTRIFLPEPAAASQRLGALADVLADRGDDVTVLTSRPPRARASDSVSFPYRVRRWPVLRDGSGAVRGYVPYLSFDIPAFFRVLFGHRPDVVIVEPPPTTGTAVRIACGIRRVPYVYYAADILSIAAASAGAPRLVARAVRWLEGFALRGAARVVAVTEGVAAEVRTLAPRVQIDIVGHGVDSDVFNDAVEPEASAVDAVYMGTASELHGAVVFADALRILADRGVEPRVAFVGQGSEWEALRSVVSDLPYVSFEPPVSAVTAARRLRGAGVALASLKPHGGYDFAVPTKMYSAVAVGTPVIVSGPPSLRTVVESSDLGWACDDSPHAVAAAIEAALESPLSSRRRAAIASWARENVSASAVADRVARALDAAAGSAGTQGIGDRAE